MSASRIWGFTARKSDQVGGRVTIGNASMLVEPWNPVAGTKWVYDMMIIRGTGQQAAIPDPFTGLYRSQRVKKAEVTCLEGLPVTKTLDWVDLDFADQIQVPGDAWIDWDAKTQKFITVSEAGKAGLTAKSKVIVHYEDNLFGDTKWHDGSPLSLADMVMSLVLSFDRAKPESKLFDTAAQVSFRSFQETFRGIRIVNENPLVIEYYTDQVYLDSEYLAGDAANIMWPFYAQGPGAWHTLALGIRAEENNELAFSAAKADKEKIEWMSYIAGPSLAILSKHLDQAASESYIPYAPTMGKYVTAQQAAGRYENLKKWNQAKKHFWLGTGALYLEQVHPVEKIAVLKRFGEFADSAEKWAGFAQPKIAEADLSGPSVINRSRGATFDLAVTFDGEPYLRQDIDYIKYMVFDSRDTLVLLGEAEAVADGKWQISLSPQETAKLPMGATRIEVVVVPNIVSIPCFENLQVMTLP